MQKQSAEYRDRFQNAEAEYRLQVAKYRCRIQNTEVEYRSRIQMTEAESRIQKQNTEAEYISRVRSSWGRWVGRAFGKVLVADLSEVLVRPVANPRALLA